MYEIYLVSEYTKTLFLSKNQVTGIFTKPAQKLIHRVKLQGGKIVLNKGSLKPEFRAQIN